MDNRWLYDRIRELKEERNAVIVAHYYQVGEVQDAPTWWAILCAGNIALPATRM